MSKHSNGNSYDIRAIIKSQQFKEQKNHYSVPQATSELEDLLTSNRMYQFKDVTYDFIKKISGRDLDSYNVRETGKFISLSANLLMSNSKLNKDLDKVLPLIRKNIYGILRRKQLTDFTLQRANTEERIKREILTASNALLLSGTGTVTDVFFSNFMVK